MSGNFGLKGFNIVEYVVYGNHSFDLIISLSSVVDKLIVQISLDLFLKCICLID